MDFAIMTIVILVTIIVAGTTLWVALHFLELGADCCKALREYIKNIRKSK